VTYVVTFNVDDELRQWERRDCSQQQLGSKRRQ
jgi:hypothetical protein